MICNITHVNEGSTIVFSLDFTDENGVSFGIESLKSVRFQVCDASGTVINNRSFENGLLTSNEIVLSGPDLLISDGTVRYIAVSAVYDSNLGAPLPLHHEQKFIINDLKNF